MKVYMDEMPKDCYECPCYNGEWDECRVVDKELDRYMENDRPEWCPIVLVKHGHWVKDRLLSTSGGTYGVNRCSVCEGYWQDIGYGFNYCPRCGAKMDE